jgi:outer membrane biosynthesis protein TonB
MPSASRRDITALAISIALHGCAFALLAIVPPVTIPPQPPEDQVTIARILHIERKAGARAVAVQGARSARPRPLAPELHVTVAHVRRPQVVADAPRYAPPSQHEPGTTEHAQVVAPVAGEAASPLPSPSSAVASVASAAPAPSASPGAGGDRSASYNGVGNFGETYDASVPPDVRSALLAGIGAGVIVRIEVDENGNATEVTFLRGTDDPALRARLLAAHYTPASCNGLPCAGTFELKT